MTLPSSQIKQFTQLKLSKQIGLKLKHIALVGVLLGALVTPIMPSVGSVSTVDAQGQTPTPVPTYSTTPVNLVITGTVNSGTAGVNVPSGLAVSLHIARPGEPGTLPAEILKRDGTLGADNTYRFENATAQAGDIVFTTIAFQNTTQGSPLVQLQNGQTSVALPVTLYAVTNDASIISLIRMQHILDYKPGGLLQVLATYDYKNTSDRLYLSANKTPGGQLISVNVPLPIGARGVAFNTQPSSRFSLGPNVNAPVVQDTKPVLPGQTHEIVFSYQVPYSKGAPIDQDYPYGAASLEILIPDDISITIQDPIFATAPNTTINPKRSYTQYALKNPLKPGDRLVYALGGAAQVAQPAKPQPAADQGINLFEVLLILVIVAGLIGGAVIVLRRSARPRQTR